MAVDSAAGGNVNKEEGLAESSTPAPRPVESLKDEVRAVARKFSDQPVQNPDSGVWAVLTAISKNARQRPQGMNILLSEDEHCLGRGVEDTRCQIGSPAVSAKHCRIFRDKIAVGDSEQDPNISVPVFLKDTSTNGTFLNWRRLRKHSPQARLQHGDLISFIAPPHDDNSYAFVYREVHKSNSVENGAALKRKSESFGSESKRLKGIGIGAPDGPISLDDVRSLQRSNTELRQQLETQVITIETLRNENRATITRHENELKEMKERVSNSYLDQIKELQHVLNEKQKELDMLNTLTAESRNLVKDLNERLSASMQSRVDADEIIQSQKATISEVEAQLDEERNQRRGEREKAAADLKVALQKAQLEAQEEIKRQNEIYIRQHREQQEVIGKLQESEKESRLLVETLRSKLEDARESLVMSEKKVRQLEVQLQDEQLASTNSKKKSETLESETKRLKKELEIEKVAREEAWAKVSELEFEIAAAIRDLSMEKQRFQGARERIILRETQLRAFYSTTEEISALFAKQQEQLKAMQKTLEDEENYENASIGIDLNEPALGNFNAINLNGRKAAYLNNNAREASGASTPKDVRATDDSSGDDDDASTTEKHDCVRDSQVGNTQDLEYTSTERLAKELELDIDAVGTAVVPDGDPNDTEQVVGTESQAGDAGLDERNSVLHKSSNLGDDTMPLDDEAQVQGTVECTGNLGGGIGDCSQARLADEGTGTIRTADLLASEVAGSWAVSTAPSVHGENEYPGSMEDAAAGVDGATGEGTAAAGAALLLCSDGQAAGSQSNVVNGVTKLSNGHGALNSVIDVVATDINQHFQGGGGILKNDSMSDAETEEGSNNNVSDDDDDAEVNTEDDEVIEGGNEVMIEDSVG